MRESAKNLAPTLFADRVLTGDIPRTTVGSLQRHTPKMATATYHRHNGMIVTPCMVVHG